MSSPASELDMRRSAMLSAPKGNTISAQAKATIERRFAGDHNVTGNFDERFLSGVTALQLVAEYPFGVGEVARREELQALNPRATYLTYETAGHRSEEHTSELQSH